MLKRTLVFVPILALGVAAMAVAARGQAGGSQPAGSPSAPDPRKLEVARTAEAFVKAYEAGDAKAVASFWTEDADYTDIDGRTLKGRAAIEADFARLFAANKGMRLHIHIESARFPTADTAVEDGVTSVSGPAGTLPSRARYHNTLVKSGGKWMLSSVRESAFVPPNNRERLAGLEWIIGSWADSTGDAKNPQVARVVFDWTPDMNYIISLRGVQVGDSVLDTGSQRIGWDPVNGSVRSWNFETDGGFGESAWARESDTRWVVKSTSVLVSGHRSTSTGVVTLVDADTITWQTKDQTVDGKPVPDGPVMTFKRDN